MEIEERLYTKTFKDKKSKDCYLSVCKWLANNIVSNIDFNKNIRYNIEKSFDEKIGLYVYTLNLYISLDFDELQKRHCAICKETHSSFFISEETNCNWCKIKAFLNRLDNQMQLKKKFAKEKI